MGQLYEVSLAHLSPFVGVSRRMHILTEGQLSATQLAVGAAWFQMPEHGPP